MPLHCDLLICKSGLIQHLSCLTLDGVTLLFWNRKRQGFILLILLVGPGVEVIPIIGVGPLRLGHLLLLLHLLNALAFRDQRPRSGQPFGYLSVA